MTATDHQPRAAVSPPVRTSSRIPALDGVRGLAVALVVVYHFAPDVLPAGFIGVDLFFVLSGFLITSLALGEHDRTATMSMRAFYARRARRLLPAAITAIVVVVAIAVVVQPDSMRPSIRGQGIAALLYGANWWSILQGESYQAAFGAETPLSHFWSLAVEEQFYVVFPLLLLGVIVLLRRQRGRHRDRDLARPLLAGAVVLALVSATWMWVLYDPTADPSRVYFGTDTRLHSLLVGIAGACAWWLWSHRLQGRGHRLAMAAVGGAGLVFLLWVAVGTELRDPWLYRFGFLAIAVGALALVLAACSGRSPFTAVFELRWLCALGLASYSIYLWHWPVKVFLTSSNTSLHGVGLFVARVVVTAAAATFSYYLIERPFRSATRKPVIAVASVAGLVVAGVAVWVIARPVPPDPAAASTDVAPTAVEPAPASLPPLRVLWLGDSVAWTMGGGHFDYPEPDTFTSPFDETKLLIWNKASYGCPLLDEPKRSFGVTKVISGTCLDREGEWPKLMDQFPPDVVMWSAAFYDTFDDQTEDGWLLFGSPEWDQLYLDTLEGTRQLATSRGALFVIVGQADPIADPSQKEMDNLLPENIWRWGHLRDLQRRFAESHPNDTRFVDLQPIVCPDDSCARMTLDDPGLREDGVHFWHDTVRPIAPQIQDAFLAAVGRDPSGAPIDPDAARSDGSAPPSSGDGDGDG